MAGKKLKKSISSAGGKPESVIGYPTPMSISGTTASTTPYPYSSGDTVPDDDVPMTGLATASVSSTLGSEPARHVSVADSQRTQSITGPHISGPTTNGEVHHGLTSGLDIVGRGVKKLVSAINELDNLGIESLDLPLPKVVVVGDQSAGKSSLIEAISEIKVPRDVGTCTRCPLHITLKANNDNAEWNCQVSLLLKYSLYSTGFNTADDIHRTNPFHPWSPKDMPVVIPFQKTKNKDDLEEILRWAQIAVLNPGEPPSTYVDGSRRGASTSRQENFSPNIVQLEISGPHLPNLSFYDLPGVINQTENVTDRYLVKIVKNMVREYVRPEKTLVLLAISMEGDVQNSTAARIVQDMDACGRCVGVLTKPDRLPIGDPVDIWESILNGEKFPLEHQYFVTKQPSKYLLDQGISHSQARAEEELFFASTEPWKSRFSAYKSRFGTLQLQAALSGKLEEQIVDSLEPLSDKIRSKLLEVDTELATLPDPPTHNAMRIIVDTLARFDNQVQRCIEGEWPNNEFKLEWRERARQFQRTITEMRPVLIVTARGATEGTRRRLFHAEEMQSPSGAPPVRREPPEPIKVDSDCEADSVQMTPTKKRKLANDPPQRAMLTPQRSTGRRHDLAKRFTLPDIQKTLQEHSTSELPNETDPRATNQLILRSIENWDRPLTAFVEATGESLRRKLCNLLDDVCGAWRLTEFYKETTTIIHAFFEEQLSYQHKMAQRAYRLEVSKPMTLNEEAMEQSRQRELETFRKARHDARAERYLDENETFTGKRAEGVDRQKKIKAVTQDQLGPDPFQREVEAMARVRGYYNVASSRFVDHVCQSIHCEIFECCRTLLHEHIVNRLGIFTESGVETQDRCARLLADDPARERRRTQLKKEKESLLKAQDRLASLQR